MIVRATKKLLNTSGIDAVKKLDDTGDPFPGEWYAGLVPTGIPGKMVIHFLHTSTKLSMLCPGKSLNKVLPVFPERLSQLLQRLGFSPLFFQFQTQAKTEIYATDNRSMLGNMIQMKYLIQYHIALAEKFELVDFDGIEDLLSKTIVRTGKKRGEYVIPARLLKELAAEY